MCSSCNRAPYVPLEACPHCGRKDAIAVASGVETQGQLGTPGLVAKRVDVDDGRAEVTVHSAAGWNVLGSLDATGRAEHQFVGRAPVGRPNELHSAKTLSAALSSSLDSPVTYKSAADERGEDVVLTFADGRQQAVQITLAIADSPAWSALGDGIEHVHCSSVGDLADGLRRAIQAKARKRGLNSQKRSALWLDARLVPVAAWKEVIEAYLSRHPPPCEEFGFADVWVVGPTTSWCQSLCVTIRPHA